MWDSLYPTSCSLLFWWAPYAKRRSSESSNLLFATISILTISSMTSRCPGRAHDPGTNTGLERKCQKKGLVSKLECRKEEVYKQPVILTILPRETVAFSWPLHHYVPFSWGHLDILCSSCWRESLCTSNSSADYTLDNGKYWHCPRTHTTPDNLEFYNESCWGLDFPQWRGCGSRTCWNLPAREAT